MKPICLQHEIFYELSNYNKYTPRILHTTEFLRNFELKKRRPFKIVDMIVNNIVTKKKLQFLCLFFVETVIFHTFSC